MPTDKDLRAIRRRADRGNVTEAVADRVTLLAYIDEVNAQVKDIGDKLREIEGSSRILLGLRILQDGHAPNLGRAIDLAGDLDAVALLYPVTSV